MQPDQFIMDIFEGALTAKIKTFVSEVLSMKLKWARGNSHGWTRKDIVYEISSLYTNIHSDGTWARELDETDQIIALTTQIDTLQKEVKRATVALATSTQENSTPSESDPNKRIKTSPADKNSPSTQPGGDNNFGANQPYTVKPWKLGFEGNVIQKDGTTFYWCTKDHWSNKVKYNGMYYTQHTNGHDIWRKQIDAKQKHRLEGTDANKDSTTPKADEAQQKKLSLIGESLRAALCTQAGLSSDVSDRLWKEACDDTGYQ